jgi:hypothetical protein
MSKKNLLQFLFWLAVVVSVILSGLIFYSVWELNQKPDKIRFIENIENQLNQEQKARFFLLNEIEKAGLSFRDFRVLVEIIRCESSWKHYNKNGDVIVSSGNVGYAQINKPVWRDYFLEMGIDIYKWKDNLRAAVILYKNQGIRPWKQWSGHCFLEKISNL